MKDKVKKAANRIASSLSTVLIKNNPHKFFIWVLLMIVTIILIFYIFDCLKVSNTC